MNLWFSHNPTSPKGLRKSPYIKAPNSTQAYQQQSLKYMENPEYCIENTSFLVLTHVASAIIKHHNWTATMSYKNLLVRKEKSLQCSAGIWQCAVLHKYLCEPHLVFPLSLLCKKPCFLHICLVQAGLLPFPKCCSPALRGIPLAAAHLDI